jgi:hypothetical protein
MYLQEKSIAPRPACGSVAAISESFLIKLFPKEFIGLGGRQLLSAMYKQWQITVFYSVYY